MKAIDKILTKAEIMEALIKADCPEEIIDMMGNALLLFWKAGWLQELLLAQKQAGMKELAEWIECEARWNYPQLEMALEPLRSFLKLKGI